MHRIRAETRDWMGVTELFAKLIRELIQDSKDSGQRVSQQELADLLGMTRQSFNNKMARDTFYIEEVIKIARHFGMDVVLRGNNEYILTENGAHMEIKHTNIDEN